MLKKLTYSSLSIAALAASTSLPARAAPPDFCQNYAQAAVNQVRGALANPACAASIKGPRWNPEFQVHCNWRLTQLIPAVEGRAQCTDRISAGVPRLMGGTILWLPMPSTA